MDRRRRLSCARIVFPIIELSSLLVNMRDETKEAVTIHLRSAVWNWIDFFPAEFNDTIRTRGRTEGTPERVFDVLYAPFGQDEKIYWPTLTVLHCITSDRMTPDYQFGTSNHKSKKVHIWLVVFSLWCDNFLDLGAQVH